MIRLLHAARLSSILIIASVVAGCAGLPTESFVAPATGGRTYDHFVAYAAFSDLGARGAFEHAMCARLKAAGETCETMLALTPPTQRHSGAGRRRAAAASGAQAVIVIELANPKAASRRILAAGRPGYRVSLVDLGRDRIVARFAVDGRRGNASPAPRARAVADAVFNALKKQQLLTAHR